VPVAGTPVGVTPELAEAGGAMVTSGFAAGDLADTMASALEARVDLGCRAREIVEREFTLEATWPKWIDLYQQVRRR
jgi:glycosyltransferase involved in cell wall biosynthesis